MAYKVLSNILVKDTTSTSLVTLNSAMLVITVNKDTKNNAAFKELDKAAKTLELVMFFFFEEKNYFEAIQLSKRLINLRDKYYYNSLCVNI